MAFYEQGSTAKMVLALRENIAFLRCRRIYGRVLILQVHAQTNKRTLLSNFLCSLSPISTPVTCSISNVFLFDFHFLRQNLYHTGVSVALAAVLGLDFRTYAAHSDIIIQSPRYHKPAGQRTSVHGCVTFRNNRQGFVIKIVGQPSLLGLSIYR